MRVRGERSEGLTVSGEIEHVKRSDELVPLLELLDLGGC